MMPEEMKNVLLAVSSSLAAMFLKDAIKKGYGMEIPSLGIKIEGQGPQPPHCGHIMDKKSDGWERKV